MLRRLIAVASTAILISLALLVGAWAYMAGTTAPHIATSLDAVAPAEVGLVLGTERLMRGRYLNPFFSNRIDAAAALYATGKVKYLIVSGNQAGASYDEPRDMKAALVMAGVPADRIYRDNAGFRTLDSVLRAKSIFGQEKVIVISQRSHLERALFLAQAHGLNFQGFAATDPPRPLLLGNDLREAFARPWAILDVLVDRRPRLAGKAVALGVDPAT